MKGTLEWKLWGKKIYALLEKYKFVFLVILAGIILLLLPTGKRNTRPAQNISSAQAAELAFDVEAMEQKIEGALSQIDGAGNATVVLTVRGGPRQVLAQDGKQSEKENSVSNVIVSKGSGLQDTVVIQQVYPQYQGALVVCPGGGNPAVRLKLVDAVSALTGLGADKISVCQAK